MSFVSFYSFFRKHVLKIDDRSSLRQALDNGMTLGKDPSIQDGVSFDPSHAWLISIGDRVTIAPRVIILAHDASTKRVLGYTIVQRVKIGDDVFIGAGSIIMPGAQIGNHVIIGAGSIVTGIIEDNVVVVGSPARVLCTYDEYMENKRELLREMPIYDSSYLLGAISVEKKEQMKSDLDQGIGFIV